MACKVSNKISVINPSTITTPYILVFTSYITCSLFYYVSTHMLHIIFPPSSCNSLCHLCQLCLAVVLLLDHLVSPSMKTQAGPTTPNFSTVLPQRAPRRLAYNERQPEKPWRDTQSFQCTSRFLDAFIIVPS